LDVEKAFDKVWHEGLVFKLVKAGVPDQLLNIIKSFLSDRTFKVKINGILSSTKTVSAGVPQGSCLSPELFSVFINDMPQHKLRKTAIFADDTLFYASSYSNNAAANKLQAQIDLVQPWFHNWKISINPTKSTTILFTNRSTFLTKQITINGKSLDWAPTVKYLGVTLDKKLTFSKHIEKTLNKSNIREILLISDDQPRKLPLVKYKTLHLPHLY
jgi:hypothetical protein